MPTTSPQDVDTITPTSILHMLELRCDKCTPINFACRFFLNIHTALRCTVAGILLEHRPAVRREVRPLRRAVKLECVRVSRAHEGEPISDQLFAKRCLHLVKAYECGAAVRPESKTKMRTSFASTSKNNILTKCSSQGTECNSLQHVQRFQECYRQDLAGCIYTSTLLRTQRLLFQQAPAITDQFRQRFDNNEYEV